MICSKWIDLWIYSKSFYYFLCSIVIWSLLVFKLFMLSSAYIHFCFWIYSARSFQYLLIFSLELISISFTFLWFILLLYTYLDLFWRILLQFNSLLFFICSCHLRRVSKRLSFLRWILLNKFSLSSLNSFMLDFYSRFSS